MTFFDDKKDSDLGPPPDMFRFGNNSDSGGVPVKWFVIAGAIILLFIGLSTGKTIYANILWFDSVGFRGVYSTVIATKLILFAIGFITAGIIWSPGRRLYLSPRKCCCHSVVPTTLLLLSTRIGVAVLALEPRYLVEMLRIVFGI